MINAVSSAPPSQNSGGNTGDEKSSDPAGTPPQSDQNQQPGAKPMSPPIKTPQNMRAGFTGEIGGAPTAKQPPGQVAQQPSENQNPYSPPAPSNNEALKAKVNGEMTPSATDAATQNQSANETIPPAAQTADMGGGNNNNDNSGNGNSPKGRSFFQRFSPKMVVGAVLLLILILGSGAGLYLSQRSQDIRQDASITCSMLSENDCKEAESNGCIWNPGDDFFCDGLGEEECNSNPECSQDYQEDGEGGYVFVRCYGGAQNPGYCSGNYQTNEEDDTSQPPSDDTSQPPSDDSSPSDDNDDSPAACSEDNCSASCSLTGCSVRCEGVNARTDCGWWPARFRCEGQIDTACNENNGEAISGAPDYDDPANWCKTFQFDSNGPHGTSLNRAAIVYVGDGGQACYETDSSCVSQLDWDCSNALSCNATCTSDSQCTTVNEGYRCLPTFTFTNDNEFSNVTQNVNGVGSGTITSFSAFVNSSGQTQQYLVQGGQIYFNTVGNSNWQNVTRNVNGVGSGTITSFSAFVNSSGQTQQYLVQGGQIYFNTVGSANWENVTQNVNGVGGSGTITHFSATQWGSNVDQRLVRSGRLYYQPNFQTEWQDATTYLSTVGSGAITSYSNIIRSDSDLGQYVVRNGEIWYRQAPDNGNRCRLASSPSSTSCNITTPPPESTSLSCTGVTGNLASATQADASTPLDFNITYEDNDATMVEICFNAVGSGSQWSCLRRLANDGGSFPWNTAEAAPASGPSSWYNPTTSDFNHSDESAYYPQLINSLAQRNDVPVSEIQNREIQWSVNVFKNNARCDSWGTLHGGADGETCTANASCRGRFSPMQEEEDLQCNSECTITSGEDECAADLGSNYSCYNGNCRLTSNPTNASCQPAQPRQCNQNCTLGAQPGEAGACSTGLSCIQVETTGPEADEVWRCRDPQYPDQADCRPPQQMCLNISMEPREPQIGDQITFTCAEVQGVSEYRFSITPPGELGPISLETDGNSNRSVPYSVQEHGTYEAQCYIGADNGEDEIGYQCENDAACSCFVGRAYCDAQGQCRCAN